MNPRRSARNVRLSDPGAPTPKARLTPRQRAIMRLLNRDLTQKEIGDKLGISRRTVEDHLAEIRSRLGARNTIHAMSIYFGWRERDEGVPLPEPVARPVRDELHGPLTPALRFEILVRDHFTCQYCGRKAPDVVLHVDHRLARARGGTNDRSNLVTSCSICNQGKGTTGIHGKPTAVTSTSIED